MGTITATVSAALAMVRLDVDWSDDVTVKAVTVWRVVDGEATQVRLPGPYDVDGQTRLVAGVGVFYDTEMPLDVPVTYEARTTYVRHLSDSFTRNSSGGWDAPDGGVPDTWTVTQGPASVFSVDGEHGVVATDSADSVKLIRTSVPVGDQDVRWRIWLDSIQGGVDPRYIDAGLALRYQDDDNLYWVTVFFASSSGASGFPFLHMYRRVGGLDERLLSEFAGFEYQPNVGVWVRALLEGPRMRLKTWPETGFEPDGWLLDGTDHTFTRPGPIAARTWHAPGAQAPFAKVLFDDLTVTLPGQTTAITSGAVTVPGNGLGWLRDPLRPGNSRTLAAGRWDRCGAGNPIIFEGLGGERFAADTGVFDQTDYPRPSVLSNTRKAAVSSLRVKTPDKPTREQLAALLSPGSPLLLQLPAVYEFDDTYLTVSDVDRNRIADDHRRSLRRHMLPFAVCDPPAGPAQGTVGARWRDQCGTYATLQAMTNAGVTWRDVLQGEAS